jgi:hypothetical protein
MPADADATLIPLRGGCGGGAGGEEHVSTVATPGRGGGGGGAIQISVRDGLTLAATARVESNGGGGVGSDSVTNSTLGHAGAGGGGGGSGGAIFLEGLSIAIAGTASLCANGGGGGGGSHDTEDGTAGSDGRTLAAAPGGARRWWRRRSRPPRRSRVLQARHRRRRRRRRWCVGVIRVRAIAERSRGLHRRAGADRPTAPRNSFRMTWPAPCSRTAAQARRPVTASRHAAALLIRQVPCASSVRWFARFRWQCSCRRCARGEPLVSGAPAVHLTPLVADEIRAMPPDRQAGDGREPDER